MVEVSTDVLLLKIGCQFLCALAIANIDNGGTWYLTQDMYDFIGFFVGLAYHIAEVCAQETLTQHMLLAEG